MQFNGLRLIVVFLLNYGSALTKYILIIVGIVFFGVSIASCVLFTYNFEFYFGNQSVDQWLSVASFYNNALTPGLLLVSIILIFFTWQTSKKELEATRIYIHDSKRFDLFKVHLREFSDDLNKSISNELIRDSIDQFVELPEPKLLEYMDDYFKQNRLALPQAKNLKLYKSELANKLADSNFSQILISPTLHKLTKSRNQFLQLKSVAKEIFKKDQSMYEESIFTHKFTELLIDINFAKDKDTFIKELIFCIGKHRLPSLIELIEGEDPKVIAIVREIEKRLK